ncbi:tyrosine-protein phosphatase [Denitromonas ohlonensis]|uniref:Tyrosine-protein phosphatase n=2 Tax=Denitromonas TaxID=139331 RepID=A0A557SDG1_9RHOO|nr:tyrosine-protein phosphatase [Denitromonas ohlonensis]TVT48702.1 MAG: tyrosine-protein phosphatase [Denitromonas halophila]TVO63572.1 tyrosine-protein phosphatase [Denitromonas ohlonensis]TVO75449.1 tyrosine-protein phosphatase [Denitromonas ohlonensis]TVT70553.1 MAG: tyrosine-protein phosphatase [Denitromonas halophila]TVT75675.1 MAG: tyrosine-protein phosphatase [Denitromonas halophila]
MDNPSSPLEGASNFRDLGGLHTEDGQRIRHGVLFRSDSLADLTIEGLATLERLELKTICDLRDRSERLSHPNRLPANAVIHQPDIGFLPQGAHDLIAGLGRTTPAQTVHLALSNYYRRFPTEHASNFSGMFDALLAPGALPALIHCTSGKDRTGFAIALVLSALGVSRELIRADYLRSNMAPRNLAFMVPGGVPPSTLEALMKVRADYLEASFATIEAHWLSVDTFLEQAIGLDRQRRIRLRTQVLEPH